MRTLIAAVLLVASTAAGSAQSTSSGSPEPSEQAPYSLAQVQLYCTYPWRGIWGSRYCNRPYLNVCECNIRTYYCSWRWIGGCR